MTKSSFRQHGCAKKVITDEHKLAKREWRKTKHRDKTKCCYFQGTAFRHRPHVEALYKIKEELAWSDVA